MLRDFRIKKLKKFDNAYPSKTSLPYFGRIMSIRGHGGSCFAHLDKQQIYLKQDILGKQKFNNFKNLVDIGDIIEVSGKFFKTKTGEKTVQVKNWKMLAKSLRPLPEKWHGLQDKEIRFRKRYLDLLMNDEVRNKFIIRSKLISSMRRFLEKRGYIEVETPVLQPIYGGGLARPFKTHHNALHIPLYLRISTELYLKRLIVGGLPKVFEIAKVFRNEGFDKNHNPEFTILETMEAYVDYKDNMKLVEQMTSKAVKDAMGKTKVEFRGKKIDFKTPWKRITMVDSVKKITGVDFNKIKDLKTARETAKKLKVKLEKFHNSIGMIIASVFEEKVEHTLIQPTIIYDFPVETSPLAKKCQDNPNFVERWEHYVAGMECSNNYSELNDPLELAKRFQDERKKERLGDAEAHQTDKDFIEAMEYAMPPTSGIGPGIDRLAMIVTNSSTIREVILFPTMRPKK